MNTEKMRAVTTLDDGTEVPMEEMIWLMHNGEIPEGFRVGHKDGDPLNNQSANLVLERIL